LVCFALPLVQSGFKKLIPHVCTGTEHAIERQETVKMGGNKEKEYQMEIEKVNRTFGLRPSTILPHSNLVFRTSPNSEVLRILAMVGQAACLLLCAHLVNGEAFLEVESVYRYQSNDTE
jgi:hypothetical protein